MLSLNMLSVANKLVMLSVIMLNVAMLRVVALCFSLLVGPVKRLLIENHFAEVPSREGWEGDIDPRSKNFIEFNCFNYTINQLD